MENFEQKRKNAFYSKASNKMDMRKSFNPSLFHSSLTLKEKINEDLKLNTNESEKEQNIINDENIYVNRNSLNNNIFKNNNDKKISLFEEMRNSLKPLIKTKTLNDRVKKNIKRDDNDDSSSENEPFLSLSKSFLYDLDNNKQFGNLYHEFEKSVINYKRKNSISYFKAKNEKNNNLLVRSVTLMKKISNNYNNLNNEKNKDATYIDEKEIIGKNIEYLKGKNENLEINQYENTNKNNISNISINLFIKKIAMDDLRTNYNLLYISFLQQYNIFLSLEIFIEKVINAFNYYKKLNSIEYPELINLLNTIILDEYKTIETNENLISKIKSLYKEIKDSEFLKDYLKEDTLNVYFILFSENEEFDLNLAKFSINNRRKNNLVFLRRSNKSIKLKTKKSLIDNIFYQKSYFYIFDYSEEEIAIKLTKISYNLMSQISINELLNSNFSKKDKKTRSPTVTKIIQRFDNLTLFIIEDIFSYDDPKKRAEEITKWIKIAEQCKNFYNFNETLVINTCFSNYLFKRAALTWKKVPNSTIKSLNSLRQFCSNNQCYINIRREMKNRRGRFHVPYLGILLKEIVNLEEKYKYILNNGNINCCKIQKLYIIINQFFSFKNNPFTKQNDNNLDILENLTPKDEDQLEVLISKVEPKLFITAGEDLKRKTKTDVYYYMNQ